MRKRQEVNIIDDIDRLSNEQIRQVFQLVTAVARFPNTTYLLSFDREIVSKALKKVQEGSGDEYLEKIIQLPIHIPDVSEERLSDVLIKQLNAMLEDIDASAFNWQSRWNELFPVCIMPFIRNIRDIGRLCNLVRFKLLAMSGEVELSNLVSVAAIELFSPAVFSWIKENKPILTGEHNFDFDKNKTAEQKRNEIKTAITEFVGIKTSREFKDEEIVSIMKQLSVLFPYFGQKTGLHYLGYNANEMRRNDQIACPDKFARYFSLNIDDVPLKRGELRSALETKSKEELVKFFLIEEKKGLGELVLQETCAYISLLNEERVQTLIQALFEVAFQMNQTGGFLTVPDYIYAEETIRKLFMQLPEEKRYPLLNNIIRDCSVNTLQTFAMFLNTMELAFGKLAAEGQERGIERVITLEQLNELEAAFVRRVRMLWASGENPLLWSNGDQVIYLMEHFDTEETQKFIKNLLRSDENVLRYISSSIIKWRGGFDMFEIKDDYKKYLAEADCTASFDHMSYDGTLFDLPEDIQEKAAVLYLNITEPGKYGDGRIEIPEIRDLLDSRRNLGRI